MGETVKFNDRATIGSTRKTADGYLATEAFAVRTGIQLYRGSEVGLAQDVVRVYRPESEVRDVKAMATFSHAPITLGHPDMMVDASNWSELAKGEVSTEAEWHDNKIKLPLIVKDAAAISAIEGGTRELSAGYLCTLDMTPGVTPEGEAYDAVQRDIRINHIAIVPKGRAGSECRIGDADAWGASPVTDADKEKKMTLRKVLVDGLEVETTDAGATAIDKLTKTIADANAKLADAEAKHAAAIAAKDKDLAARDAEIADLKKAALTDAQIDARVAARADLIAKAKTIDEKVVTDGKTDMEIRRAVLGDAVKDKSDAYVEAAFDIKAKDAGEADPLKGLKAKPTNDADPVAVARQKMISDMQSASAAA